MSELLEHAGSVCHGHDCPVWVIVPAYNEERTLAAVLEDLLQHNLHVVVVDDGSHDRTAQVALNYPVSVLRHLSNLGQGAALQTGILYALRTTHPQVLVTFDSDGQHSAKDIEQLVAPLQSGQYDVVLGTRFALGGQAINIRPIRRALLWLALQFTRLTTGLKLTDTHNGLRAFTAQAAGQMKITHNRMAHASQILSQIASLRLRYCEVPIVIRYTDYSMAKGQTFWDGINILWELLSGKLK